ncbi:MAG: M20/M25/M40 family metallo-hydrolase [Actinobacteria bacterium]|nr:M20/M25/M40 family metallo-hydrolase [Actinomycetota bacterium]
MTDLTGEVTDLLQHLIRNACVNDGTATSGQEFRSADQLEAYLGTSGLEIEAYEPVGGRRSLVTRIEGSDPSAPTVCLMGHTDVVPVSPAGWRRDPFGGELVDGEVWGRGAIDMLNLTASMAVAVRHLARSGFRPRGTLVYFAVADEEAGGHQGAEWVTRHHYDAVRSDYVLTESGGISLPGGPCVTVTTGEKGVAWRRLRVTGTPGHGSMPFGSDNALVKAAEVVRRLVAYRPRAQVTDTWRAYVAALGLPDEIAAGLTDPERVWETCASLADPRFAAMAHACTHMTFSPNVAQGGVKTNVIPDVVDIDVDIRTLPGESADDIARNVDDALGDLASSVTVSVLQQAEATDSPMATPLWESINRVVPAFVPRGSLVPRTSTGGTDARFFREKGAVAYGFGLFSPTVTYEEFATRFHGHDERVDVESLRLSTEMWIALVRDLIG